MTHKITSSQLYFFALLTLFILGCGTDSDKQQEIIGSWQGVSWEVNGVEDVARATSMVLFSFNEDETYNASLGNHSEAGVFRLQGDKLYTTADGMEEIMVQVEVAAPDTLIMLMNRMGVGEKLTLVRQ